MEWRAGPVQPGCGTLARQRRRMPPLHPRSPPLPANRSERSSRPPAALDRAVAFYREKPEEWAALRGRIMADAGRWSWDVAAGSYVELYDQVSRM